MLSRVDKYMEFTMRVCLLFTKLQVVDKHIVYKPVDPRNMSLLKPADILFYHTEMGEHIKFSGGNRYFKMKKPLRGDKKMEVTMRNNRIQRCTLLLRSQLTNFDTLELVNRVGAS